MKTVSFGTESLVFLGLDILDKIPNRFKSLDSLNEFLQNIKFWVLQQDFSFRLCKKLQSICYFQLAKKLKNIIICIYIYIYIYIYILMLFAVCQKKVLKTFPDPAYLRSEEGLGWLLHFLVNLNIYICIYIYIY